jgi:hypothetical protein
MSEGSFSCRVIVRTNTEERLASTCFRGARCALAGNFRLWDRSWQLLRDPSVRRKLLAELSELFKERESPGVQSFAIDYGSVVGWSSTDSIDRYTEPDVERFELNRRAHGWRVKESSAHLFAPKTDKITFVVECKREGGEPVAVIHSVYPGDDIGELSGDVSEREGVVFFDWSHAGA